MSGGTVCKCGRRDAWVVSAYKSNRSAFNGYQRTPSDYSAVTCSMWRGGCGTRWRTKAAYVETLPRSSARD